MGEKGGWNYSDLIYNLEKGDKKGLIKIPHERCFPKFINKFEWFIAFDAEDEEESSKKSFFGFYNIWSDNFENKIELKVDKNLEAGLYIPCVWNFPQYFWCLSFILPGDSTNNEQHVIWGDTSPSSRRNSFSRKKKTNPVFPKQNQTKPKIDQQ